MKKVAIIVGMFIIFAAQDLVHCFHAYGEVEVEEKTQFNLDGKPLDIATSLDGDKLFVLMEGKVLIYSVLDDRVTDSIAVDRDFDKLTLSGKGRALILSSSSGKRIQIIHFQILERIDVSGLPFRGTRNAAVTLAVFGDYQ